MDFKKKKSNFEVVVFESSKSMSCSFYSYLNVKRIIYIITDIIDKNYEKRKANHKIRVRIYDKNNENYFYINEFCNLDKLEFVKEFNKRIKRLKGIWDLKTTRYQLRVRNHESIVSDSKIMSFHSKDDFDDIFLEINKKFRKYEQEACDVVFSDEVDKKRIKTHTITLMKGHKTKSFSVIFANYPSIELLEMIIK